MKIYFLRHGEAEEKRPGLEDRDRPLTSKGAAITSNTARKLKNDIGAVDIIFTSPLLRAVQTADIFANALASRDKIETTESLLVGTHPSELLKELKARKGVKSALLAGHQPHLGVCVSFLTGISEDKLMIKKGSCLLVESDDLEQGRGRLVWSRGPEDI